MGRTSAFGLRVGWGEADPFGIVFYPNFFAWFDRATHELFRGGGHDLGSLLRQEGFSVPIAESGARFVAPAFYDDELVVTSTVTDVGSRAFRVEHTIDRAGQTVATGFEVRVMARPGPAGDSSLETVRIPDDLRSWLAGE